jgi:hypothetical protein
LLALLFGPYSRKYSNPDPLLIFLFVEACAEQPRSIIASQIAQRKLKLTGIPLVLVLPAFACM